MKIRVFVSSLLIPLGISGPASAQQAAATRVAYVNSLAILQATPGYAKAESTFTKEMDTYRIELGKLQAGLDSAVADFDQQSVLMSPTARAARRKDLEGQQTKLQQRTNELNDKAQTRRRELLEPIQTRVNAVIEGLRAEGNYGLIFDITSAGGNNIVTADPTLDLTTKVVERLQAGK